MQVQTQGASSLALISKAAFMVRKAGEVVVYPATAVRAAKVDLKQSQSS